VADDSGAAPSHYHCSQRFDVTSVFVFFVVVVVVADIVEDVVVRVVVIVVVVVAAGFLARELA
jgi:hypothetical protein